MCSLLASFFLKFVERTTSRLKLFLHCLLGTGEDGSFSGELFSHRAAFSSIDSRRLVLTFPSDLYNTLLLRTVRLKYSFYWNRQWMCSWTLDYIVCHFQDICATNQNTSVKEVKSRFSSHYSGSLSCSSE